MCSRNMIRMYTLFLFSIVILSGCAQPKPTLPHIAFPEKSTNPITETRKSVIIYPEHFSEAARAFSYLHQEFGDAEAILVSLDEISSSPLSTKNIHVPYPGWENQRPKSLSIKNYDFNLAKKIIAYLRDLEKREDILAVLLLGDGALIPPSYYFHLPYLRHMKVADVVYNEWVASDLLYASPDFDMAHEWAVGRISVNTPDQALYVADKYYRWGHDNRRHKPHPFIYFAGNIQKDILYSGELLYQQLEYEGIVDAQANHYFESDNRFTINHLKESFASDPGRLHYIYSHGKGDGFEIDGSYLYSHQIAAMPYKDGLPLIVSPSCLDGGFDYDLIDVPHDMDGYSIGEAVLLSEGAGIGYLGSSRVSLGELHFREQNGAMNLDHFYYRYMPGLLFNFFIAYHGGHHRIGDAYVEAHRMYRERFDLKDPRDFATFVEINLLADPVMLLPEPPARKTSKKDYGHLKILSKHSLKKMMPLVPLHEPIKFALRKNSPHHAAMATVVDTRTGKKFAQARVTRTKTLILTIGHKGSFLIRLDFDDGTVSWQNFRSGS